MTDVYVSKGYIRLPSPLTDLIYCLGIYTDGTNGVRYDLIPQASPANYVPAHFDAVGANFDGWMRLYEMTQDLYLWREFLTPSNYNGNLLVRCSKHDEGGGIESVKGLSNTLTLTDSLLRFANEEFLGPVPEYGDAHHWMVNRQYVQQVVAQYASSYLIKMLG